MSQHDLDIANQSFPAFRSDLNDALEAIATLQSGGTAPATTYGGMPWIDTSEQMLKFRNVANDGWIDVMKLDLVNDVVKQVGQTVAPNGSVSQPSYTFDSDSDTGIYRKSANSMGFGAGGNERMVVKSTGVDLLGTATAPTVSGTTDSTTKVATTAFVQAVKGTIDTSVQDGSVTTVKLATDAVTSAKLADDSVGSEHLQDNEVGAAALNVSGNGTAGQVLASDGDGSFSWADDGAAINGAGGGQWSRSGNSFANSTVCTVPNGYKFVGFNSGGSSGSPSFVYGTSTATGIGSGAGGVWTNNTGSTQTVSLRARGGSSSEDSSNGTFFGFAIA